MLAAFSATLTRKRPIHSTDFYFRATSQVYLIGSGEARVLVRGREVYTLSEKQFVGEMGIAGVKEKKMIMLQQRINQRVKNHISS